MYICEQHHNNVEVIFTHVSSRSRARGTLWGVLLALILGLIARIPQSDIVLIAAICCIGVRSSTGAAGLLLLLLLLLLLWLLGVLLVAVRLLILLLLGLGEGWGVVVLVLVVGGSAAAAVLLLLCDKVRGALGV